MKTKSTSSIENIFKIILYTSIGFLAGLLSYYLIKFVGFVIGVCVVVAIVASVQRNKYNKS
jgi:uncharacterized membrane protein SpoIIM required for sporulation